jgi:hypothetical protein
MNLNFMRKKTLFTFLKGIVLVTTLSYTYQDRTSVSLSVVSRKTPDKIVLSIKLQSQEKTNLLVPSSNCLLVGYEDDDSADCFFKVYKLEGDHWQKETPSADYQSFNLKKGLATLQYGEVVNYAFALSQYYHFDPKNQYKIRLTFRLSRYNPRADINSPWLYLKTN